MIDIGAGGVLTFLRAASRRSGWVNRRCVVRFCAVACAALAATAAAIADEYPSRPIRFIVPYTPGGTADYLPRMIGAKLIEKWGVPIIVENRPGAGSMIGIEAGAKAPPDGYTYLLVTNAFTVNPSLHASVPYDVTEDFTPVIRIAATPHVLVVSSQRAVKSVAEFVEAAKRAGNFSFASVGVGSQAHFEGEHIKREANIDLVHVPYKGVAPALLDVIANNVTFMFAAVPDVMPSIQGGKLKPLAVTGSSRSAHLPALPTMIESGYSDFIYDAWFGVVAPRQTPPEYVAQMKSEIATALQDPEINDKLQQQGLERVPPEDFGAFLAKQLAKYKAMVAATGIKGE